MNKSIRVLATIATLCLHQYAVAGDASVTFGTLTVNGPLIPGDLQKIKDATKDRNITRVRITSPGGDGGEAIRIADWISARALPLEVRRYCLSSCATFVLPAAKSVNVVDDAVIAFHALNTDIFRRVFLTLAEHPERIRGDRAQYEKFVKEIENSLSSQEKLVVEHALKYKLDQTVSAFYTEKTLPEVESFEVMFNDGKVNWEMKRKPGSCKAWLPDDQDLLKYGIKIQKYVRPAGTVLPEILGTPTCADKLP